MMMVSAVSTRSGIHLDELSPRKNVIEVVSKDGEPTKGVSQNKEEVESATNSKTTSSIP